jgi:hypothetical protein
MKTLPEVATAGVEVPVKEKEKKKQPVAFK